MYARDILKNIYIATGKSAKSQETWILALAQPIWFKQAN